MYYPVFTHYYSASLGEWLSIFHALTTTIFMAQLVFLGSLLDKWGGHREIRQTQWFWRSKKAHYDPEISLRSAGLLFVVSDMSVIGWVYQGISGPRDLMGGAEFPGNPPSHGRSNMSCIWGFPARHGDTGRPKLAGWFTSWEHPINGWWRLG